MHIIQIMTLISTTCALSRFNLWSSKLNKMDAKFSNYGIRKKVTTVSQLGCVLQCQMYFSKGCGYQAITRQCRIYMEGGNTKRWKPEDDFHFFIPLAENSKISWTDMRRSGHNFALHLSHTNQTWAESRTLCGQLDSRLYVMDTEKKEAVTSFLEGKDLEMPFRLWLGLSDIETEGKWFWESGKKVDDNVWAPNEPNNMNTGQDCGYLRDDFLIDDIECSSTLRCICELVYTAI